MTGTIKKLTEKGFGFITGEGLAKDLFFHSNALVGVSFNELHEGDAASFDTEESPKGLNAVNVKGCTASVRRFLAKKYPCFKKLAPRKIFRNSQKQFQTICAKIERETEHHNNINQSLLMEPIIQPTNKTDEKFSLCAFTLSVGAIATFYILTLKTVFPNLWLRQLEKGLWPIIAVSLGFHLFNANFEFFFHRYVLHCAVIRWLKKFYRDHSLHHALTIIFRKKYGVEKRGLTEVVNRYPIVEEKQYKSSFFPYWGLAGFTLFFSPLTILLQWLLPQKPILLGSFMAIAFSYCLYELLHALEHVPYESFWKGFVENPMFGSLGKKVYGFHMFHHANVMCNMAISGFFGLPVFDWFFGTYKQPRELLLDGTLAKEEDFSAPKPCWFIHWLDNVVAKKTEAA